MMKVGETVVQVLSIEVETETYSECESVCFEEDERGDINQINDSDLVDERSIVTGVGSVERCSATINDGVGIYSFDDWEQTPISFPEKEKAMYKTSIQQINGTDT